MIIDLRLIGANRPIELADGGFLRVHLLLSDHAFLMELIVSLEVSSRVVDLRLVARKLTFHLFQRNLVRPGIDFRKQIALMHKLAFLEIDLLKLPVHSAFYGDRIKWRH